MTDMCLKIDFILKIVPFKYSETHVNNYYISITKLIIIIVFLIKTKYSADKSVYTRSVCLLKAVSYSDFVKIVRLLISKTVKFELQTSKLQVQVFFVVLLYSINIFKLGRYARFFSVSCTRL